MTTVARFDLEQPVCHMGSACMQSEPYGDYVLYSDYAELAEEYLILRTEKHADAEAIGALREERDALIAQLEAANQRVEMLADSVAKARAEGRAEGLWAAVAFLIDAGIEGNHPTDPLYQQILSLILADTPAEPDDDDIPDTPEPAKVTLQEAAKVLLGDDFTSPLLEVFDAYNNDYEVGQDVLKALRAIAGGRDE